MAKSQWEIVTGQAGGKPRDPTFRAHKVKPKIRKLDIAAMTAQATAVMAKRTRMRDGDKCRCHGKCECRFSKPDIAKFDDLLTEARKTGRPFEVVETNNPRWPVRIVFMDHVEPEASSVPCKTVHDLRVVKG